MVKVTFETSEDVKDQIAYLINKEAYVYVGLAELTADEEERLNCLEKAEDLREVVKQIEGVK